VDWWQVPGRDEAWRQREIGNLGSQELFNQEYGNQFLSSSSLLLGSEELRKIRTNEIEYEWRELSELHYSGVNYENLIWHPKFDTDTCDEPGKKFVISIDLSGGGSGDYTVMSIFKVTPLPKSVIESLVEYEDESDFFGLIQVGIFRDNEIKLEDTLKILQILCLNIIGVDRVKIALEMNFKGELLYDKMISKDDFFDEMFLFTKHTEAARVMKVGIKYNEKNKMKYCELLRSTIKEGKIMINEKKWTVPELFTFGLNNRGTYSSQSGHDDVAMTLVNLSGIFEGYEFNQMVGEMFDELENDNQYKNMILRKLEGDMMSEEETAKGPKTKEGRGYSDFNNLL
jgi:hypothetical protein